MVAKDSTRVLKTEFLNKAQRFRIHTTSPGSASKYAWACA